MVKWKLITALILLLASAVTVAALPTYPFCDYKVAPIDTPCTMITHILRSCPAGEYTYNITQLNTTKVVINGSLVYFSDGAYYFNLTVGNGDYFISNCDGSSRVVRVRQSVKVNLRMIAVTLGLIFMVIGCLIFGALNELKGFKLLGYGIAVIETVVLAGFMYAEYSGIDFSSILRFNLMAFFILAFAVGMIKGILFSTKKMDLTTEDEVGDGKWGRRWR